MFYKRLLLVCTSVIALSSVTIASQTAEVNESIQGNNGLGKTYVSGFSFTNREIIYEKKNGLAIFEGDIVLGTVAEAEEWLSINNNALSSENMTPDSIIITGKRFRWENNIVPYQFSTNVLDTTREMVMDAISHWSQNTHIKFIERNPDNAVDFPDFINIISDNWACWSYVGKRGGKQDLNVVLGCGFGGIVHELGHAIGLWHEQSREDRDQFVQINWENIQEGRQHNFNQHINDATDVDEYDYESIMHYGTHAFSNGKGPTITPLQDGVRIGQRDGLSTLDISSVVKNYPAFIPIAQLTHSTNSVLLGNSIVFDASLSFDPNGQPLNYLLNLGDGTVSTAIITNYIYDNRGVYNVSLTVTDPDGYSSTTDTVSVNIYGYEVLLPAIISPRL